jgi:hypothetical protein
MVLAQKIRVGNVEYATVVLPPTHHPDDPDGEFWTAVCRGLKVQAVGRTSTDAQSALWLSRYLILSLTEAAGGGDASVQMAMQMESLREYIADGPLYITGEIND